MDEDAEKDAAAGEIAQERDEVIRRMLNTPPQPHKLPKPKKPKPKCT